MSVELSVNDFRTYFNPVFADTTIYTDDRIEDQLDQAMVEVSEATFGKHYRRASYYLTAHFLSLFVEMLQRAELAPGSTAVSASKGIMTSSSVADLSKSLEMPDYNKGDDKFLASTQFGQEYIRLRNRMCRGGLIANQAVRQL